MIREFQVDLEGTEVVSGFVAGPYPGNVEAVVVLELSDANGQHLRLTMSVSEARKVGEMVVEMVEGL